MELFENNTFYYRNNDLYCEDVSVKEIVDQYGTPVYVYSKDHLIKKFKEFTNAFNQINHTIFYACKANFNLNVIKIFAELGSGIDVNSAGELYRAFKANISPDKIILSGVGKTKEEIKLAISNQIHTIKVESYEEINLINQIASLLNKIAPVSIRVNPDVDAKTHPYISTGLSENKFGINAAETLHFIERCKNLNNVKLIGLDMHIGSQILSVEPYIEAASKVIHLFHKVQETGIKLHHIDLGGGFGVKYKDEKYFSPDELAEKLTPLLKNIECEVIFEPGRFLTANAGILVTEILYSKKNINKNFLVVDAAMTELTRPSLYGSYHHIQPIELKDDMKMKADIVGPVCETTDFLAKDRVINNCKTGDKLAVMSSGAYGMVMSSNYNGRRRPPEIIVDGNKFYETRSRETFDHLLWDEKIVSDIFK